MKLERQANRLGVGFWLPAALANGAFIIAVFGAGAFFEGEEWVRARFHMSTELLLASLAFTSTTMGLLVGVLNPYVAKRWHASMVGAIACIPMTALLTVVRAPQFDLPGSIGITVLVAALIGGLGGAAMFQS